MHVPYIHENVLRKFNHQTSSCVISKHHHSRLKKHSQWGRITSGYQGAELL
jgi:hypothetical protein